MPQKGLSAAALGLILIFALLVQVPSLGFLLPDFALEDEMIIVQGFHQVVNSDFESYAALKYPGLIFLLLGLFFFPSYVICNYQTLVHLKSLADLKIFLSHPYLPDPAAVYLGRVMSMIAGIASVWLFFAVFRRRLGDGAALLSSLFLISSYAWLFSSSVLKIDSALLLSFMLLLYASYGILDRGDAKDYALAGVGLGLCLASKYHFFALAPLIAGHWLKHSSSGWRKIFLSPSFWLSILLGLAVFFVLSPFPFLHPLKALDALRLEFAIQSRELPLLRAQSRVWFQSPILFQLTSAFPYAMGMLGYLIAILGMTRAGKYFDRKSLILFVSYPAAFFAGWAMISRLGFPHLYLTIIPFFAVFAGIFIDQLFGKKIHFKVLGFLLILASVTFNLFSFQELNRAQSWILDASLGWVENKNPGREKTVAFFPYRPLAGSRYDLCFNFLPQFMLTEDGLKKSHPEQILVHQTYYLAYLNHPLLQSPAKQGFIYLASERSSYRLEREWKARLSWAKIYGYLFPDLKNLSVVLYSSTSSPGP